MIEIENNKYNLIENYKEGFDLDAFKEKYTEYFEPYDYIIGDWSYGKLRLKGFCTKLNKMCNKIKNNASLILHKFHKTKKTHPKVCFFLKFVTTIRSCNANQALSCFAKES